MSTFLVDLFEERREGRGGEREAVEREGKGVG
jgi:hypothetical protein